MANNIINIDFNVNRKLASILVSTIRPLTSLEDVLYKITIRTVD